MVTLAALVKTLRQARGLSQAQLGTKAGIGQTYLSDIEKGKTKLPSVEHRRRLATTLGTTNIELLMAAGEVGEEELIAWARQGGFVRHDSSDGESKVPRLAAELAMEDAESPRVGLALQIPFMTRQEAAFLTQMFMHLPTEAHAKRRTMTPQEYRQWRDLQDVIVEV